MWYRVIVCVSVNGDVVSLNEKVIWYSVWVNVYCENDDVYVSVWNDKNDDSEKDCDNCLRVIKEMKSVNERIIECEWNSNRCLWMNRMKWE